MVKLALWFVGLIAVAGLGAFLYFGGALDPLLSEAGLGRGQVEEPTTQVPTASHSELETGTNTSNQALEQDLNTLDTQLHTYGDVEADVESSLQDTPVQQEY